MTDIKKTGTTTVGIVCKNCIVLAADTRATAGSMILDDHCEKILPLSNNMGITIAGHAAAAQMLHKHLRSQLKLRELQTRRTMNVEEMANLMASFNFNMIQSGSIVHMLLGGVDKYGPRLFDVFPDGSIAEKKDFFSSGSGSMMAFGVFEDYKPGMSEAEGLALAEKAIMAAIRRDSASGNGIEFYVIDAVNGLRNVASKRLKSTLN